MLTQLEVVSPGIAVPPFDTSAGTLATDPVQIRNIEGLGPVPAAINTQPFGSIDGEAFGGANVGKRNIVLTLGLNPDWAVQTIAELRRILYSYFMPKNQVRLVFTSTHMVDVDILGYVETVEPNIFSKDPQLDVSIICPTPYFKSVVYSAVTGTTLAFGDNTATEIEYFGDLPTGFVLDTTYISAGATLNGELRILNQTTNVLIVSTCGVDSGKYTSVSTVQGQKFVRQIALPGGAITNLLGKMSGVWVYLDKGINEFIVQTANPGQSWSLQFYSLFGGL